MARIEELAAKINEAQTLREQAILEGQAVAGAIAKKLFAQFFIARRLNRSLRFVVESKEARIGHQAQIPFDI